MGKIAFIDNNFEYIKYFISRNYTSLSEKIITNKEELTYYETDKNSLYGYKISANIPLSELYKNDFYSVRFYFANIETLHLETQEDFMLRVMNHLQNEINQAGGYYNLRIPTHIIDLVKAYNTCMSKTIFCGGTVEQYINNKSVADNNKNGLNIFMADYDYIMKNKQLLLDMTYKSFELYQGQYHISPVTEGKAGIIYENWIKSSLSGLSNDKIVVAEWKNNPIGFVTIAEDEHCVEGVLSAVSDESRELGAYKAMISYIINYSNYKQKCFITSTQFDNFIVQGVWNSLGLKPFYSIYNVHVDNRRI